MLLKTRQQAHLRIAKPVLLTRQSPQQGCSDESIMKCCWLRVQVCEVLLRGQSLLIEMGSPDMRTICAGGLQGSLHCLRLMQQCINNHCSCLVA